MASDINLIFQDIKVLISWKKAYNNDSTLVEQLCLSSKLTPRIVPAFQDVLNAVDNVEIIHSVPWGGWLLTVCSRLIEAMESLEDVVSVTNLTIFRGAVSKLITFSVLPHLNCELPYPSEYMNDPLLRLTDKQKHVVVDIVTRVLASLLNNGHTRGSVLQHYGVLLGALISIHGRTRNARRTFKDIAEDSPNSECLTDDASRQFYQDTVSRLLDDVHQTTVFTHLMILNTVKGDGGKVSRVACRVLESKVQQEGGVAALLSATVMSDQTTPSTHDVLRVSSLLTGKHSSQSFHHSVLPQVLSLLKEKDVRGHQVAANCISLLKERDPDLCERYMIGPLLTALESPCRESDIDSALLLLSRWVHAAPPGTDFSRPLPLIFLLYSSIVHTPCALKINVEQLLVDIFNCLELPCSFLLSCCFPPHPGVSYILSPSCSVVSASSLQPVSPETTSKLFLYFISEKKLSKIKADLYRSLLRYVLMVDTPLDHKLISTELLTELSSDTDVLHSISSEPRHLIDFLLDLFSNKQSDSESISLGLVLLTVFLGDNLVHKKSNWDTIAKLEGPLLNLKKSSEFEIQTLAGEILLRLRDLGILKTGVDSSYSTSAEEEVTRASKGKVVPGDYEEAIKESMDPHLPVRAHALRTLAKLLQANDKATLQNKTTILNLFKANLEDEDSYLYLSAIDGLASLASVFPDDIINILCDEFATRQIKPEVRLKIGQVIVKTTNLLGEMGAVYKKVLLGSLLRGVGDPDPLVRASSLSNIGEIAKILSFRIYDHLIEIFDCVEKVVETEKECEPRRAAVMLITLLLEGLGQHMFTVLEDILPELYRKLKVIYQTDKDEVTKLHAQLALQQLADTTRGLLFPQQTLTKRISLLDVNK